MTELQMAMFMKRYITEGLQDTMDMDEINMDELVQRVMDNVHETIQDEVING